MKNITAKPYAGLGSKKLLKEPLTALAGMSRKTAAALEEVLGIRTVQELADSAVFFAAREISALASAGAKGADMKPFNKVLTETWQNKSPLKTVKAPLTALDGISRAAASRLKADAGLDTLQSMAAYRFYAAAQYIQAEAGSKKPGFFSKRSNVVVFAVSVCLLIAALLIVHSRCDSAGEAVLADPSGQEDMAVVEGGMSGVDTEASEAAALGTEVPGYYEVRAGDTLMAISAKTLGDASRWKEIFDANAGELESEHLIFPGQRIKMPEQAL